MKAIRIHEFGGADTLRPEEMSDGFEVIAGRADFAGEVTERLTQQRVAEQIDLRPAR
jgi:hypothetical protein